jgi:hypothetical protein
VKENSNVGSSKCSMTITSLKSNQLKVIATGEELLFASSNFFISNKKCIQKGVAALKRLQPARRERLNPSSLLKFM